ncbi:hypothetical protein Y032_0007g3471 [Ancylostoma ceylanicum]|uniref:Uncharacterized protein n=1 Tax=Ancylostoma ceylanicum TaxID=53326 RepID=A0A016VQ27_9BILA|nr:hypothetical protein Y032_0007g3471 [Ancylostoma ceylanicum]
MSLTQLANTARWRRRLKVLLDNAHCDLAREDKEDLEANNDEKMDVNWDKDCGNIGARSSPLVIELEAS